MKFFYVPAPIYQVLHNNFYSGREFLDVNKLLDILSPEDLSFYLWANLQPDSVLPKAIVESGRNILLYGGITVAERKTEEASIVVAPWDKIDNPNPEIKKIVNRCVNDYCVSGNAPQLDLEGMELISETFWLEGGQVTLFTHVPVMDNLMNDCERVQTFYLRLAQQQLQFNTIQAMACEPWFLEYLEAKELCESI